MRARVRSLTISRLITTIAALWLCGAGSAWAGDGGEDLGGLNGVVTSLCQLLGIASPCPQLPTISQAVLQIAAWENAPLEAVRAANNVPLGNYVDAGNPSRPPAPNPITAFPVPAITTSTMPPVIGLSGLLPTLTPLAFSSQNPGPAAARRLYDPAADTLLYAVASGISGQPDTLYFFLEDLSRTNMNLLQGQIVAQISFLLTVLNSDAVTERPVPTTLQFRVQSANGKPCSASSVVGDFNGSGSPQTLTPPTQIGVDCAVVFSSSPILTKPHAIFEVKLLPLVTGASFSPPNTDPAYFTEEFISPYSDLSFHPVPPLSPLATLAFLSDELGAAPSGLLGTFGKYIGVAPSAGPLCTPVTCPAPPTTPPPGVYALCANLPGGNGNRQAPVPAVAAFYAIATTGETLLSAPIVPSGTLVCPSMPG